MIYITNPIYARVWKKTMAENGKYMDLQITTSEKDSNNEGKYINSSWFPRAIGHALNSLQNVQERDAIVIKKAKISNERFTTKDGEIKSSLRFIIFEAEIEKGKENINNNEGNSIKKESVKETPKIAKTDETPDESDPW